MMFSALVCFNMSGFNIILLNPFENYDILIVLQSTVVCVAILNYLLIAALQINKIVPIFLLVDKILYG